MANTITIDLDSLSEERAQKLAGFILTYACLEQSDNTEFEDAVERASDNHLAPMKAAAEAVLNFNEPSPQEVFGGQPTLIARDTPPMPIRSTIAEAGPTLVILNPPTQAVAASAAAISPTAVSAASPAPTGTVVDSTGLPWDSRIHSTARTFNADGTWRARRGLADGYAALIEKELRQVMSIPSPSTAPTAPVAQTVSIPPPPPPLPPATASPEIKPYLDLMNKVSSALAGAQISQPQLQKVCEAVGLPNFVSLGTRLDLVPVVAPMIDGILAGASV